MRNLKDVLILNREICLLHVGDGVQIWCIVGKSGDLTCMLVINVHLCQDYQGVLLCIV